MRTHAIDVDGGRDGAEPSRRIRVHGLELDALDEQGVIDRVFGDLERSIGGWLVTPNVDILRQTAEDAAMRSVCSEATLLIADGAPVEWAAKLSGQEMPGRVPGASLFWTLTEEAARRGRSVMLLGGRPGAAEQAAERLRADFPGLVVHHICPPLGFQSDPDEMEAIRQQLAQLRPDLVFCGLGAPKQERLMVVLHPEFPSTWFFGFGGSIDIAAGMVPRAPEWMQRGGIEWLFRLASEPRRLSRRYLVHGVPYSMRLFAWALKRRLRQSAKQLGGSAPQPAGGQPTVAQGGEQALVLPPRPRAAQDRTPAPEATLPPQPRSAADQVLSPTSRRD